MDLLIQEIAPAAVPLDLLLLADPSSDRVRSYLPSSICFVASQNGSSVGACVVQPRGPGVYELMNIAVHPKQQRAGVGTTLLEWLIEYLRRAGATHLEVGTGSFGYQLAFYQRHGFRVTSIDRDFFVKNYEEPIIDKGIRLKDMVRLTLSISGADP